MRNFIRLLAFAVLAAWAILPAQAGVSFSGHGGGGSHFGGGFVGGGFHGGGYRGGYRCFNPGRGYGFYGYGFSPFYGYASYPIGYDSGYDGGSDYSTAYAPPDATQPQPSSQATNPAAAPTGPLPAGKVDEFGYVHSPFSTTTFKAANVANGQVFYDPTTGQPFMVHVTPSTTAPAPAAPSATALPTGKLDEFGYVHSPFSTFVFKVQNGNYAQTFRDPFTGQGFTTSKPETAATVASAKITP